MIRYPNEEHLPAIARENIARFKKSSIAAELDASPEAWSLDNWPWTADPPHRFVLRNDRREGKEVIFREHHCWVVRATEEAPKIRPANLVVKL